MRNENHVLQANISIISEDIYVNIVINGAIFVAKGDSQQLY